MRRHYCYCLLSPALLRRDQWRLRLWGPMQMSWIPPCQIRESWCRRGLGQCLRRKFPLNSASRFVFASVGEEERPAIFRYFEEGNTKEVEHLRKAWRICSSVHPALQESSIAQGRAGSTGHVAYACCGLASPYTLEANEARIMQ